ncbi:hypothetical protein CLV80_112112 [Yoonia maritima]|uniref:Uncharacterized protein n=1 Tax=Yoonia maritima TaxID=1435347 RepID=A0A2T0VV87_9RHOB|nr:hypothetical protein CLV80_112112 [Yoonia maritima]
MRKTMKSPGEKIVKDIKRATGNSAMRRVVSHKVLNAWVPFARPHPNGLHIAGEGGGLAAANGGFDLVQIGGAAA